MKQRSERRWWWRTTLEARLEGHGGRTRYTTALDRLTNWPWRHWPEGEER